MGLSRTTEENLAGYAFLGFGVGDYRGFSGGDIQRVGPFGKVHLLVGQNNSGKSALVNFCTTGLMDIRNRSYGSRHSVSDGDVPLSSTGPSSRHAYRVSLAFSRRSVLQGLTGPRVTGEMRARFGDMLSSPAFSRGDDGVVWFDFTFGPNQNEMSADSKTWYLSPVMPRLGRDRPPRFFQDLSLAVCGSAGDEGESFAILIGRLCDFGSIPPARRITAIRHVSEAPSDGQGGSEGLTGEGLNVRLSELKSPELADRAVATERWASFMGFVRGVLNDPGADVDVSSRTRSIAVRAGGTDYLPLSSLGTGVEELVIMAAEVPCTRGSLVCIEEPEIHLHPSLQARFMRYLMDDDGGNRFLVTTHSASVINTSGVTLTQVYKRDGVCRTRPVTCGLEARETLDDLGARPSDLLQTNYVVWVEGPSDRVYVRSWLARVDAELAEGAHYSVMFYGGKLLSSLGAGEGGLSDPARRAEAWRRSEGDLVSLFRLGTHFCVLMDSDKTSRRGKVSATKRRVAEECEASGALAWVTDYRTIENYVPEAALREALAACSPNKSVPAGHPLGDKWVCPLSFEFEGTRHGPNKVDVARQLEGIDYELDQRLTEHVRALADAIREANGMPAKFARTASSKEDEK